MEYKLNKTPNLSEKTLKGYNVRKKKVLSFHPNLLIKYVDSSWIEKFSQFLRKDLDNSTNTIAQCMWYVRGVLKVAKKNKIISDSPFDDFEIKTETNEPPRLSFKEVELLEDLYSPFLQKTRPGIYKVLQFWLFAIFTGIDYGDTLTLHSTHFRKIGDTLVIDRTRKKNGQPYTVPISEKANKYLPEFKEGLIFDVINNTTVNDSIKEICKLCCITKVGIRFHTGRHTFATMSLNLGISLEILKQWMGHSSVTMTEHYAKMIKTTSSKAVSIWNEFAEQQNNK